MYPAKVVESTPGQRCPSQEQWAAARAEVYAEIISLIEATFNYK